MKHSGAIVLAVMLGWTTLSAQTGGPFVNYRIFPSTTAQTEPVVVVHPTDPLTMFASGRTIRISPIFQSEGVYVTTNGGVTWFGSDVCTGRDTLNHGGDPGLAIRPDGRLILTHIGDPNLSSGMFSHYSTDLGTSWSTSTQIFHSTNQPPDDRGESTAIDKDPSSPFYGKTYIAWAILGSPFAVLTSYSTDGAQSWSAPTTVNPSPPANCSGAFTRVGNNGAVYTCWAGLTPFPFNEDFVGFAASSNGGATWRVIQNAFDMNGIRGTLPLKGGIRVDGLPKLAIDKSGGPRNGWIYIVTTQKNLAPAGSDPDIILRHSTDDGLTWSAATRVNLDPINNGKIQYFPAIDIDYLGGINIIFNDDRNTSADSSEIMLARSADGGSTWREWVISDHRFQPEAILGVQLGYQGDHIALISVGNKLYPFWMDNFVGTYQIWTSPIDITTLGVDQPTNEVPGTFELKQNYPNPFNPATTIDYTIDKTAFVTLRVLDITGREIVRLVNERQSSGVHSTVFNAEAHKLSSGTYFYQLSSEGHRETRAMALVK